MSYNISQSFFFLLFISTFETALSHMTFFVCDLSLLVMSHTIQVILYIFVKVSTCITIFTFDGPQTVGKGFILFVFETVWLKM